MRDPPRVVGLTGLAALQLAPVTPVIEKAPLPIGAATPVAPTTVAVKVKLSPKLALAVEVVIVTVGARRETVIGVGVVGPRLE